MAHYIDKDAVVAEIERRKDMITKGIFSIPLTGRERADATFEYEILEKIKDFIDTLEVKEKEVDLEDSIKETLAQKYIDYTFKRHNIDPESKEGQLIYYAYMHGMNQCLNQIKA